MEGACGSVSSRVYVLTEEMSLPSQVSTVGVFADWELDTKSARINTQTHDHVRLYTLMKQ